MSQHVRSTISLSRRLFSLPSYKLLVALITGTSLLIGALTELLGNMTGDLLLTLGIGAVRGILIISPSVLISTFLLWLGTKTNGILRRHRILGVITAATIILLAMWFVSTLLGWLIELIFKFQYGPLAGIGVAAMFYRRSIILAGAFAAGILFIAVMSMSSVGPIKGALLSQSFSSSSVIVFILTHSPLITTTNWIVFLGIYFLCAVIFMGGAQYLLISVGKPLKHVFNVDGIQLFRGFLEVWMEGKADKMETCLSQIGQTTQVPLAIMRFDSQQGKPILVNVITGIHPGPFRDTGSSALPSSIAQWGQNTLDTLACAPHGTATHDLNLVSKEEVNRLMTMIENAHSQVEDVGEVSQFTRASSGSIKASCQIFGDTALITITRSPLEMDDISLPVGRMIKKQVEKLVNRCIVVDTHNCMTELKESVYEDSDLVTEMIEAAIAATQEALKAPRGHPNLGVVHRKITEYSEKDGMGPEGITVIVIETEGQKVAYVLIDGNNMVVGLREKLVKELVPSQVDAAVIMTTDTHQTSAISAHNGYSSIGERIPHDWLIQIISAMTKEAKSKMESVTVSVYIGETEPLLVMGEGTVEKLTRLIPVSSNVAKRVSIASFTVASILTLLLLILV
jgi:putative membrane protein